MTEAARYHAEKTATDGVEVVRLADDLRHTEVTVVTSPGNIAYDMKVNGKSLFFSPSASLRQWAEKPVQAGNPLLAPWANRLDQDAFWANGKKYVLNPGLGNYRYDASHQPIHGMVMFTRDWKVSEIKADGAGAHVTSRLEFWRNPGWMAQFPFAHTLEMTYRLADGVLEVVTTIENHANEPMPVSIGYHPWFRIGDAPRDQWTVHLAAREHVKLSKTLVPTGELEPVAFADPQPLAGISLDDVFGGLVRDANGRAEFWVKGKEQKISVIYGPKWRNAVVYSPQGRDFICFEPMSGPTNAFNLAHEGKYAELQSVPAGGVWRESFWVKPAGF